MTTLELKKNFHILIDQIGNEELLKNFYDIILQRSKTRDGELWNNLSSAEQKELLLAEEESNYESNLISHKEIMKKHQKWLNK